MKSSVLILLLAALAASQNSSYNASDSSSIVPTPTASISLNESSGTTTVPNPSAFTSSMVLNWDDLWDLYVGPVSTASVNTTVEATPIPTSELIPPPGLYYSSFPTGQQIPMATKNSSWSFPKGFWWGVASAAYQAEGAAKAEGRGPSIWDVLLHRVTGYTVANQTGDIADNQYYLYKQGIYSSLKWRNIILMWVQISLVSQLLE